MFKNTVIICKQTAYVGAKKMATATNNYELISNQIKSTQEMSQDASEVEQVLESFSRNQELGTFSQEKAQLEVSSNEQLSMEAQEVEGNGHDMTPSSERPEVGEFSREETHLVSPDKRSILREYRLSTVRVLKGMVSRYKLIAGALLAYRILIGFVSSDLCNLISEFSFNAALSPF